MVVAKSKETGEQFAAKLIKVRTSKDKLKVNQEVETMKCLDNEYIVKLVDAFEGPKEMILVSEYLAGGELFETIVDDSFELVETDCCLFTRQICKGLEYLHGCNIVHLDIKAR